MMSFYSILWYDKLEEDVSVQWVVDSQIPEIAAVRRIYTGREQTAVLCVTLDYNKIFQPFEKIISAESGGMILDKGGNVLFQKAVQNEKGRYGFMTEDGTVVIKYKYDEATPFKDGTLVKGSNLKEITEELLSIIKK